MSIEKIIVLEDDLIVRKNLEHQLRQRRYDVASVSTIAAAQEYLNKDNFDLIFLDVRLPDGDGTELLKSIQLRPQRPLVVISTGFASVESAVECMKNGAFDYLIKPYSAEQIEVVLKKAEEFTQLLRVNRFLSQENEDSGYELLGQSAAMDNLRQLIRKVARTLATVLIQGESGTGKELVARALYRESPRANAPFIRVNCAAIPENLIESEFFGHEKGAFTGTVGSREGYFEQAGDGTLFLDEIGDLSLYTQVKLLRVLQQREFSRLGSNRLIPLLARVIFATHQNLAEMVAQGKFRQDLYYRINVMGVEVPPLQEHSEDIPQIAKYFLRHYSQIYQKPMQEIEPDALALLQRYPWPGNVRELENVIQRAIILAQGDILHVEDLPLNIQDELIASIDDGLPIGSFERQLHDYKIRLAATAIRENNGNKTLAARSLCISRAYLHRLIRPEVNPTLTLVANSESVESALVHGTFLG